LIKQVFLDTSPK